jgi:hypothetical protein
MLTTAFAGIGCGCASRSYAPVYLSGREEIDDGVWHVSFGPLTLGRWLERRMRITIQLSLSRFRLGLMPNAKAQRRAANPPPTVGCANDVGPRYCPARPLQCVVRPSHRRSLLTELLTGNTIQTDAGLCRFKREAPMEFGRHPH